MNEQSIKLNNVREFLKENGYSFYDSMNVPRITVECDNNTALCNIIALISSNIHKWDNPQLNININCAEQKVIFKQGEC